MKKRRDFYRTDVATVREDATLREIADIMAHHAVGSVVVIDADRRPIGMLTDRDLAVRVVAQGRDCEDPRASEIMSKPLHTASAEEPLESVSERMRIAGVRRLPVVRDDELVGLVALDDLVVELGRELDDLGEAARRSVLDSRRLGQREKRRDDFERSVSDLREQVEKLGHEAVDFFAREIDGLRDRMRRPRK